ncbi:MAG: hypothetical protein Q4F07_06845 [Bacteroidales bacterium]|nr:hypothetical protein [Bacteroidales bacterium]
METIRIILELVLGCSTLLGFLLYGKANRRIKNSQADKAESEADKAEVDRLLAEIEHQQKTVENLLDLNNSLSSRLSSLNATADKHIDRSRELSDRLYKSETALNEANERIIRLTEERDWERLQKEHFKGWRCERHDCQDPRGPLPPRDKLKGLKYEPPKRAVK